LSFNGNLQPSSDAGEDLTTKGDVHGFSSENTRVPVGVDGTVLTARASDSYGIAWEAAAGGDVPAAILIQNVTSTIGDYAQPESATASSAAAGAALNVTDDFSDSGSWSLSSIDSIGSGTMLHNDTSSDSGDFTSYEALPSPLSDDSDWTLDFDMKWNSVAGGGSGGGYWFFGLGNNASNGAMTTSPALVFGMIHNGADNNCSMQSWNGSTWTNQGYTGNGNAGSSGTWYYFRLYRSGGTIYAKLFTDSGRTSQQGATVSFTTSSLGSFSYWMATNDPTGTSSTKAFNANVDNLDLTGTAAGNPASNAVDDNTATYWKSDSETNPNIYVDLTNAASDVNLSQLALYPNADSTETQIKVQYGTNAGGTGSWTDLRTINYSDLTNGQYNYIRFNNVIGRYVRIYGNNGAAKVLALNEIKTYEPADADVRNLHGHLSISNSDTSLALDGT